jgi:hypothetical protein
MMPATAISDRAAKAGVIRSRRKKAARTRIMSGSRIQSSTDRLAVMVTRPSRLRA